MNLQTLELAKLNPAEYNPREISEDEFNGLKKSLEIFGQQENLIVNKDLTVISGHMRLRAMQELGWAEALCNVVDLDKHQERKLNVVMNSQAISGKWDNLKLAEILEMLKLDDDYTELRLDQLEPLDLSEEVEEDEAPEVSSEPPVSQLGSIYQLGQHRVMCGDSTKDLTELMNGTKSDMIFADPPYGVDIAGGTHNFGSKKYRSGKSIDNDTVDDGKLMELLNEVFGSMANHSKEGAAVYVTHADTSGHIFRQALIDAGYKIASCIIWVKHAFVFGRSDYKWQHEPMLYGWLEGAAHNYFGPTNETTVWNFNRPSPTDKSQHPTIKPVELLVRAIKNSSKSGDIILDPFLGSGSTLIACEQTDRTCYGMEIDLKYVDVIRKRYHKFVTGSIDGWEEATPCL